MNALEKKAINVFQDMWQAWSKGSKNDLKQGLRYWGEPLQAFGSALHEKWSSKEDMRAFNIQLSQDNPKGFEVKTKWIEARLLESEFVALWGELLITITQDSKTIVIDPHRFTAVLHNKNNNMEIVQFHVSEPDVTSEEEVWPGTGKPKHYDEVSILFTDFVGFTKIVAGMAAYKLVKELNEVFAEFDSIIKHHHLEKVKTIGDAYMAVGGLSSQKGGQAIEMVSAAKEMLQFLNKRNLQADIQWSMRIGIHSGPVVSGVIGIEKLSFDLWGETVNLASRMESVGKAGKINVSAYTYHRIKNEFPCTYRGKIDTKGHGMIDMYFVD